MSGYEQYLFIVIVVWFITRVSYLLPETHDKTYGKFIRRPPPSITSLCQDFAAVITSRLLFNGLAEKWKCTCKHKLIRGGDF